MDIICIMSGAKQRCKTLRRCKVLTCKLFHRSSHAEARLAQSPRPAKSLYFFQLTCVQFRPSGGSCRDVRYTWFVSLEGAIGMKKLLNSALVLSAILTASAAFAVDGPLLFVQDQPLQPVPEARSSAPMPTAVGAQPIPAQGEAITLFSNVMASP